MALAQPFGLSTREKLTAVRAVLRTIEGSLSATPTPIPLRFSDVGLLYFMNSKQEMLLNSVSTLVIPDISDPELEPLNQLIELTRFLVGGLIVEAERIDETLLAVKKEIVSVADDLQRQDAELQTQRIRLGSSVDQAIAQHFKNKLCVPQRSPSAYLQNLKPTENSQLADITTSVVSLRAQLNHLKEHRRALSITQRLLHGSGAPIPTAEAAAIVTELGIVSTLQKFSHKVKDALISVPQKESLDAVHSLLEFFETAVLGIAAALDALRHLDISLRNKLDQQRRSTTIAALSARDAMNKKLSVEALQLNEMRRSNAPSTRRQNAVAVTKSGPPPLPITAATRDPALAQFLSDYCA